MSIQSVSRALDILCLFSYSNSLLGITDISSNLGLQKATVHGLVRTLLDQGFLKQDPHTRKYRLGYRVYELGVILAGTIEINQKGANPAHDLAKRTGMIVRISVWIGNATLTTLNVQSPTMNLPLAFQLGPRVPAYSSSIGKAILAFLDNEEFNNYLQKTELISLTPATITDKERLIEELAAVRQRGYSFDREETILGMACIGTPIFGNGKRLEGAISISGEPDHILGEKKEFLAKELLKTASEISRYMGFMPEIMGK